MDTLIVFIYLLAYKQYEKQRKSFRPPSLEATKTQQCTSAATPSDRRRIGYPSSRQRRGRHAAHVRRAVSLKAAGHHRSSTYRRT